MKSNIPDKFECKRLDDLTIENSRILSRLHGEALDAALAPEKLRRAMTDQAYRITVLDNVHPDDLAKALSHAGFK